MHPPEPLLGYLDEIGTEGPAMVPVRVRAPTVARALAVAPAAPPPAPAAAVLPPVSVRPAAPSESRKAFPLVSTARPSDGRTPAIIAVVVLLLLLLLIRVASH
ncbi:MAG: hypothetical protein Q8S73_20360 [Deltaproteobacteria bacterium]|nr:hypothetical protein [Myxococcales bacterium]MDP3216473.1 hypothetical protein [Deltaproteobacteria bacterium]